MSFFTKKKTCPICRDKYTLDETFHELRLQTGDGMTILEICKTCADFFDKSADVLKRKSPSEPIRLSHEHQSDEEEYDEGNRE